MRSLLKMFNLRLSGVERFGLRRHTFGQDIDMFVIHLLYRYLRISGHIEETQASSFLVHHDSRIDEFPPRGY